jgi:propanol-preferring alcohol dehydrogenase
MRAAVLDSPRHPLAVRDVPEPEPARGQLLVRVSACGVCRTDLHVVDGELAGPKLPLIPGHQIVGVVEGVGEGVEGFSIGDRVGIPWLGWTCGECAFCASGRENLCRRARFTGYTIDGGFAERAAADARFCFPIPSVYPDLQAAPLLCAGLIGYRALRMAGDAKRLGLYGFGAAAHIVIQVARHQGRRVFVFTRAGDAAAQEFARSLGAEWAGDSLQQPPEEMDAALIFAPDGSLLPRALRSVGPGGTVVCAGIHMSDIPAFPYRILWEERVVRSVANLTRRDAEEFLALAPRIPISTEVHLFPLPRVNDALEALRRGSITGAAVITMGQA